MYFNDVEEGGETIFPRADEFEAIWDYNHSQCERGLKVTPEKGSLVMFYNLKTEGHMLALGDVFEPRSLHAGCDVVRGVKWASNKWYHNILDEEINRSEEYQH